MVIKRPRESNICERCKEDVSQVGPTDYFEEYDLVLCEKCAEETIKEKNLKCPKCKKVVGLVGLTEHRGKQMCYNCMENVKNKEAQTEKRKNFFKSNWFKWIMLGLAIIAILVGAYWNE